MNSSSASKTPSPPAARSRPLPSPSPRRARCGGRTGGSASRRTGTCSLRRDRRSRRAASEDGRPAPDDRRVLAAAGLVEKFHHLGQDAPGVGREAVSDARGDVEGRARGAVQPGERVVVADAGALEKRAARGIDGGLALLRRDAPAPRARGGPPPRRARRCGRARTGCRPRAPEAIPAGGGGIRGRSSEA